VTKYYLKLLKALVAFCVISPVVDVLLAVVGDNGRSTSRVERLKKRKRLAEKVVMRCIVTIIQHRCDNQRVFIKSQDGRKGVLKIDMQDTLPL
jgi:hypothetical protein